MTGFWGTPIANEKCRTADVILAVGTRFAEANSSSWDPRFTFNVPPTRLIHIDADVAEIGRNLPTELGAVADAKARAGGAGEGRERGHAQEPRIAAEVRSRRRAARLPRTGPTITAPVNTRCAPSAFSASCVRRCPLTATS
jgi:acetolactate synthase-1/2/3 large subunit